MLLTKLHKRALHRVQMLSTLRNQVGSVNTDEVAKFFDLPSCSDPSLWSSSSVTANACTRIVCMSDTHGKHREIPYLPPGDALVHAGDFTKMGEPEAVIDLGRYFQEQQDTAGFREVLCIAGNHDITFDQACYQDSWSQRIQSFDSFETRGSLQNCTYLEDSSAQLLDGKIAAYGSPWTPKFWNWAWAFNLQRGEALREMWSKIPDGSADVLITHVPPHGRGDQTLHSGSFGCLHLLQEIQQRIKPRLHIFGHIHDGYGCSYDAQTLFVNASSLDFGYEAVNPCFVIDLPHDKSQPAMIVQPQQWIHDAADLLLWLKQEAYTVIADAMESVPQNRLILPFDERLHSGATYQSLCDQLGLNRRRHSIAARQELRTALCQLYAESFF